MSICKSIELLLQPCCFLSFSRENEEQDREDFSSLILEGASGAIPAIIDDASCVAAMLCAGPVALRPTATARDVPDHVRPWCMPYMMVIYGTDGYN